MGMKDITKYILEVEKSPADDRDFLVSAIYTSPVVLPATLDYRSELPDVRDQGSQGSCSAQTAACMKEWQEFIDVEFTGHMSPQYIYNLRENSGSYGMSPRDTMKILSKEGIVHEKHYPYGSTHEISDLLRKNGYKYRIKGYARIYTVNELKKALVGNGPCYIAFPVHNWDMYFWRKTGQSVNYGGHAVSVVGYTKDSFIIRNSWGTDWGDKGYTYYPFDEWGAHWEIWTTIDAETYPYVTPEPSPTPDPYPTPTPEPKPEPLPPTPDDDLKKKSNERLKWWQKIFFCFNEKV